MICGFDWLYKCVWGNRCGLTMSLTVQSFTSSQYRKIQSTISWLLLKKRNIVTSANYFHQLKAFVRVDFQKQKLGTHMIFENFFGGLNTVYLIYPKIKECDIF